MGEILRIMDSCPTVMTHKHKLIFTTAFLLFFIIDTCSGNLTLNQTAPLIRLSGENGGRLNGTGWTSSELKGAIYILMYVDPDKIRLNEHVEEALVREQYPSEQIRSIAITNLAATWKPKFLIEKILKEKQKKYPGTTYLVDKGKVLVEQWGLHDHSYNVLVFSPSGNLLFNKGGALSSVDVANLTTMIWSQIAE